MKAEKPYEELGTYLKNKRIKAGLSQSEVSRALSYSSAQFISNMERGLCAPPLPKVRKLMDLYKIPFEEMTKILVEQQKKFIYSQLSRDRRKTKRRA